jgi:hypothetical protein
MKPIIIEFFQTEIVLLALWFLFWRVGFRMPLIREVGASDFNYIPMDERDQVVRECKGQLRKRLRFFVPSIIYTSSLSLGVAISMHLERLEPTHVIRSFLICMLVALPGIFLACRIASVQLRELIDSFRL